MKINNHNKAKTNKSKIILSILSTVLVLGAVSLLALHFHNVNQLDATRQAQKTKDEAQTDSAKNDALKGSTPADTDVSGGKTSEEVPSTPAVSVVISNFNQANGLVSASATIQGSAQNGTCVFLFTSDGTKPVTRQVDVASNTTQICQISIPEVEFNKLGVWKLDVTYYANNQKSEVTQNVTIN